MKKDELREKLYQTKERLHSENHFINPWIEYDDNKEDMVIFQHAFEKDIEEVYPGKPWWEMTDRWDIFGNSIHKRRNVDEIIEDILAHIKED